MPVFVHGVNPGAIKAWVETVVAVPPGDGLYPIGGAIEDPPGSGLYLTTGFTEDPPGSGLYIPLEPEDEYELMMPVLQEKEIAHVYWWDEDGNEHLIYDGTRAANVSTTPAPVTAEIPTPIVSVTPPAIVATPAEATAAFGVVNVYVLADVEAPPPSTATAAVPTPVVTASSSVVAVAATAGGDAPPPLADGQIQAPAATASAEVIAPLVQNNDSFTVETPVVTAPAAEVPTPVVTASASITAPAPTSGAAFPTPVVRAPFTDNFNRADGNGLGASWTLKNGTASPGITSNTAQYKTGSANNTFEALYISPVSGDDAYVHAITAGTGGNAQSSLFLRSTTTGSRVALVLTGTTVNTVEIQTFTGWNEAGKVVRSSISQTNTAGDLYQFFCVGNVYLVLRNGVSILSWTDTGGVITPGPSQRFVGLSVRRGATFSTSFGWDDFEAS